MVILLKKGFSTGCNDSRKGPSVQVRYIRYGDNVEKGDHGYYGRYDIGTLSFDAESGKEVTVPFRGGWLSWEVQDVDTPPPYLKLLKGKGPKKSAVWGGRCAAAPHRNRFWYTHKTRNQGRYPEATCMCYNASGS